MQESCQSTRSVERTAWHLRHPNDTGGVADDRRARRYVLDDHGCRPDAASISQMDAADDDRARAQRDIVSQRRILPFHGADENTIVEEQVFARRDLTDDLVAVD